MVFSSIGFLFFFLPLLLICYYICPKKYRNCVLLFFSLLFYYFGEGYRVLLLVFACFVNFLVGKAILKHNRKYSLIIGLVFNISVLFYFKYTNFFLGTLSAILGFKKNLLNITLPLGISFFTFQNISYLVDVYIKDVDAQHNFFKYLTYISLFPQLIAGPIIRYKDVEKELDNRQESVSLFSEGIRRFVLGLGKKVLIADTLYVMCGGLMEIERTVLSSWLLGLGFTLQIYYDFSGYSCMAIGLGKMFGFNFKENFNYPLVSNSIKMFWSRWHMSLSSFFKDYVYIPLGGSRGSVIKTIRNMFIVWVLTGLWHGAEWNFVIWGLYFFVILLIEKFVLKRKHTKGVLSYISTFIIVLVSFIIFSVDIKDIPYYLGGLIGRECNIFNIEDVFILKNYIVMIIIGLIGMGPITCNTIKKLKKGKVGKVIEWLEVVGVYLIFLLSIMRLISSSFNPFIYFRF